MSKVDYKINEVKSDKDKCKYYIEIAIPTNGWIDNVYFVVDNCGSVPLHFIKCENGKAIFGNEMTLNTSALYHYYFTYNLEGKFKYHKKENILHDESRIILEEMWKMSTNFKVPDWAKGKIMYHIFVDRFYRSTDAKLKEMPRRIIHYNWQEDMHIGPDIDELWNIDFYGGDLNGITEKLDYIKSLGVSILYLSPIMFSQSNHGYDTSDYEIVDPYKGNLDDLKNLCDEAHKRGMRVILDGVFNHTGNDSKYFNQYNHFDTIGAYQNPNSPFLNFYHNSFEDGKIKYQYWFGFENMPRCNCDSKEWQEYITGVGGVIDKWFNCGIDGLRLDVADELSDYFIELIRNAVKRNKEDGLIIGEVWDDPMQPEYGKTNPKRGYISSGKCMDTVMNYQLIDALIRYFKHNDINKLSGVIKNILINYPDETIFTLMNFTSTQDISRIINILGTDFYSEYKQWAWDPTITDFEFCKKFILTPEQFEHGKEIYKAYVFALTFMPGILSIFYGDEVGVQGYGNLANRKTFPWGNEDQDILQFFRKITSTRNSNPFLETANLKIHTINLQYFMFERINGNERALFAINRTNQEVNLALPTEYKDKPKVYSLKDSTSSKLYPYGAIMIK